MDEFARGRRITGQTAYHTDSAEHARGVLLDSLGKRWRPEDTIPHIEALLGQGLPLRLGAKLHQARPYYSWSAMPQEFAQAAPLDGKWATIDRLCAIQVGRTPGTLGTWSRMANRIARLERSVRKRERDWRRRLPALAQFAETGYAPRLTADDLADDATLAFVAYMTARNGVRSVFTNTGQRGAFDTVADALLGHAQNGPNPGWFAVAVAFPRPDLCRRVGRDDLLRLFDWSRQTMEEVAGYLERVATAGEINLRTMVVRKGNDSSTWNALAGAWNKARDHYLAALDGLGWLGTLDHYCPGKALRLMAGDVVYWHSWDKEPGEVLHADTKVWRDLPPPWAALLHGERCDRRTVEAACRAHGVDPVTSGWTGPRARTAVESFVPTPELVHGVQVAHPAAAEFMRRMGFFSGKGLRVPV